MPSAYNEERAPWIPVSYWKPRAIIWLYCAVMIQAIQDLEKPPSMGVKSMRWHRMYYDEAKSWFLNTDWGTFSFNMVCLVIGLRPPAVLQRLAPLICPVFPKPTYNHKETVRINCRITKR